MTSESQFPGTLMDFIRRWEVMDGLSDNSNAQTSKAVADILRQEYNIYDIQSEPNQQNQNFAERRIQGVKSMTNTLMGRNGFPGWL
jgi:hypothetical protein